MQRLAKELSSLVVFQSHINPTGYQQLPYSILNILSKLSAFLRHPGRPSVGARGKAPPTLLKVGLSPILIILWQCRGSFPGHVASLPKSKSKGHLILFVRPLFYCWFFVEKCKAI